MKKGGLHGEREDVITGRMNAEHDGQTSFDH